MTICVRMRLQPRRNSKLAQTSELALASVRATAFACSSSTLTKSSRPMTNPCVGPGS
jgi:hypothetical protein